MENRYKFVLITENFPPLIGGGIAEWTLGVATNLAKLGHDVYVYSKWKKRYNTGLYDQKSFKFVPMYGHDWRTFRYIYSFYYLLKFLSKVPEGIVIATTWELGQSFNLLRRIFPKAKLIVISHGRDVTHIQKKSELKKFRNTISAATMVAAVSRFTKDEVIQRINDTDKKNVHFVPNGLDPTRFKPDKGYKEIKKRHSLPAKCNIILTLARVIERKGHDTVIRSLPDIINKFPNTYYIIAGPQQEPEYLNNLKELTQKLNIEKNVIFTEFVPDEELNKFYTMADIYVMVSKIIESKGDSEGFGITFLEANACGCPVIGSDSGGIPDAIEDDINGFIVPSENPNLLRDKILLLFEDKNLSKKMAQNGRARIQKSYTWDKITSSLLDLFHQSLHEY